MFGRRKDKKQAKRDTFTKLKLLGILKEEGSTKFYFLT